MIGRILPFGLLVLVGFMCAAATRAQIPTTPAQEQPTTQPAMTDDEAREQAQESFRRLMEIKREGEAKLAAQQAREAAAAASQPGTPEGEAETPAPPTATANDATPDDLVGPPAFLKPEPAPTGNRSLAERHDQRAAEQGNNGELVRRDHEDNDERSEWFNFIEMPWESVIGDFVARIGKPLMDPDSLIIPGTLTYVTDRKFTKQEAIDELNLIMYEQGYRLVEQEHHVRVIPYADMRQWVPVSKTYRTIEEFQKDDPSDMDYVVVYYKVADMPAGDLVDMFSGAFGVHALIEALDDTNQIRFSALARDVRRFLALKDKIDLKPNDPRQIEVFEIKTNAREIEQMVRQFMQLGSTGAQIQMVQDPRTRRMVPRRIEANNSDDSVQLIADERTNSIIVKATPNKMDEVASLIKTFDTKPDIGKFETKAIEVKYVSATEVANLLNQIFQQEQGQSQTQTPNWQAQQRLQALRAAQARARAAARGRNVPNNQQQPAVSTGSGTASPEDIIVEGVFERAKKYVRIVAEPRQNLLWVYANDEGHKRVREMLADLDKPLPENYRVFVLQNTDVNDIAPLLNQLVEGLQGDAPGRSTTIIPDAPSNEFHVLAEPVVMERIASLIEQLDIQGPELDRHVIKLEKLQPSKVASLVQGLLQSQGSTPQPTRSNLSRSIRSRAGSRGGATAGAVDTPDYQIIPLDDAQILIVVCSADDWAKVDDTIKLWEENAVSDTPRLEYFTVKEGDPQTIANTLASFYRSYSHPVLGRTPVAIQAEGDQILVYAVQPAIDEIAPLIEKLDIPSTDNQVQILPLVNADASQVAQQLQALFGQNIRRRSNVTGPTILAEPVTNSLVVQASAQDLEKIKDFALRMDEKVGAQTPEKKFFTLRYAQPRDVAQAIVQLFGAGGGRRGGVAVGTQIKAVTSGPQVIVEAPADRMAEIEAFITQLDDPKGQEIIIRTVTLPGSDVAQIANKLQTAFRQKKNVTAIFDADSTSETIVITINRDALEEAEGLINQLAEAGKGLESTVEFVQLRRAPAADAANWLRNQLIAYIQKQYGRGAASQVQVTFQASTNRVIINGPRVAVTHGKSLLEQYDAEVPSDFVSPITTEKFELPGLDVRSLARSLDRTFAEEVRQRPDRLRASFEADELTQTLIVSAPQDMFERVRKLVEEYQADAQKILPVQQFVEIKEADAGYIAQQLQQMLPAMVAKQYGQRAAQETKIVVEQRLNQLWLSAPQFAIDLAIPLIEKLDQPSAGMNQLRTVALENADANAVMNVIRTIFADKIRAKSLQVSVEPMTNALIVGGTDEDFKQIEKWATELDEQAITKKGHLEIVELLNANPWEVRNILVAQYSGGGYGRRQKIGQEYSFDVIAGRSLVVQAPEDKMPDILALIHNLDEVGTNKVEVRIYELPGIGRGINDLARQVQNAYNQTVDARAQRISISTYEAADTLIVTAAEDQFTGIEAMMDKFKGMVQQQVTVAKFIELKHLDASRYARQIEDMLANKIAKEGRGRSSLQSLSITPDPRTNRLICYVPEKIVPDLEEVIRFLDVEPTVNIGEVRSIELAHADADTVARTLSRMYQQKNRSRSEDVSAIEVRIEAEPITNSLLVVASDEDFDGIKKQALNIDERSIVQGNEPQVIELQYATPNEVANLVNQWYGGGRRGSRNQNEANQVQASVVNGVLVLAAPKQKFEEIEDFISKLDKSTPPDVTIRTYDLTVLNATQVQYAVSGFLRDLGGNTRPGQLKPGAFAEPSTNTLVVMAPPEAFLIIDDLIGQLESKAPKQGLARTYQLKYVRADQIVQNVDAMLKAKVAEREGVKRGAVQTSVFADPSGNRLIVYAPEDYQTLAAQLVEMVDADIDTGEIVHILPLDNANATQIAQTLNEIMGQQSRNPRGSASSALRIVADAGSNSVLLGGLPKDVARAEEWLKDLEINSVTVPELQIFQPTYAGLTEIEDTLRAMFPSTRNAQDQVTVTTDDYNNRIIVSANKRKMRQIEAVVAELDREPDASTDTGLLAGGRQLYFVDVNRGSASDIAWDVRDIVGDKPGGPEIESDWFGEYIRVTCRPSEFQPILNLIRQFESRAKAEIVVRKFDLKGANLTTLAQYMHARGEDFEIQDDGTATPAHETLVETLWGEGEEPPQVRQRRQQRNTDGGGQSRVTPFQAGLALRRTLLTDIERELYGTTAPTPAAQVTTETPVVRPVTFTPTAADDPQPPARRPQPAPTARPTTPPPPPPAAPSAAATAATTSGPTEYDPNGAAGLGAHVPSPLEKSKVIIIPQPDGTVLIKGPEDDVFDIEDVLETLTEDVSAGEVIRIFEFKYGDVSAAAEVLNIMFDVRQRQVILPQQQQQRQRRAGEDDNRGQQSNMLDQFRNMVGGRNQQGNTPTMRIAVDPSHNYLIVKCEASLLPDIRQLLRELDVPPGEANVRVFQLKTLDAAESAENIKQVLGISKAQSRRTGASSGRSGQNQLIEMLEQQMYSIPGIEGGAKVEGVEIVPNAVTNSLMISAPPEVMGLIESVIDELEGLGGRNIVGIYKYELERSRVEDLLPLLEEIFAGVTTGGGTGGRRGGTSSVPGALGPVTFSGDPRTDTVIFTAQQKDVDAIREQIGALDLGIPLSEADMYVCKWGNADTIASAVEAIYGAGGGSARGGRNAGGTSSNMGTEVRIVSDAATNTILVWGPPDKRELIFGKIKELDQLSTRAIREIDVVHADPEDLAATLMGIFGDAAVSGRGAGGRRGNASAGSNVMSSGALTIVGDKTAKKLLVRAPDEVYTQILSLVEVLDQPSQQMQLKSFPLRYADAQTVVDSVKQALGEYMKLAGSDFDLDAFTAMPDPRTNSVVVVGSEETFLFVSQIVATIDIPTPSDQQKEFRVFMLEKSDATTVAEAINSFATGGAVSNGRSGRNATQTPAGRELNVTAVAETATNSVMVFGRQEDIDKVEAAVIAQLEESVADRIRIETVAVEKVKPSEIVSYIWPFLEDVSTGAAGSRGNRGNNATAELSGPQIVPNDSAKTLVVRGTKRQIAEVRQLVTQFDDPTLITEDFKVITVPLGQDATQLAAEVERIVNAAEEQRASLTGATPRRVTIGSDDFTNTMIVIGEQAMFGKVISIVDELGKVRTPDIVTTVIELKTLSAQDAIEAINELNTGTANRGSGSSGVRRSTPRSSTPSSSTGGTRRRIPNRRSALDQPLAPLAQAAGSPLAAQPVIGTQILLPYVALLAPQAQDEPQPRRRPARRDTAQPPTPAAAPTAQPRNPQPAARAHTEQPTTAPATPAPVDNLRRTLSGVSGQLKGDVQAQALGGQKIMLTGDADDIAFIEQILQLMERGKSPPVIEVFTLEHAKAAQTAETIDKVIQSQIDIQSSDEQFSINAEGRSNSLIVSAPEDLMERIAGLVAAIDVPNPDTAFTSASVQLQNMRAAEATNILRPILTDLYTKRDVAEAARPSIAAVERSNSISIVGTPADVEEIRQLITTVDVPLSTNEEGPTNFTTADVIFIPLLNADAENVAKTLTDMIEEQQQRARESGGQNTGAAFVKVLRLRLPDGQELPPLNLDRPISIIPETGTNSLIIFSTKENNKSLTEIVAVFDTLPRGVETEVKAFALQHAAADQVAELIQETFDKKRYLKRPSEGTGDTFDSGTMPPVPPNSTGQGLPYPLLVQSDPRTNTVIVVGRSDAVLLAGGLINELDQPTTHLGLQTYVLQLQRMPVADLADKLEQLLDDRAKALGGDQSAARDGAVIQADERSNSLIVIATPEVYGVVDGLVQQLDKAEKYGTVDLRYRPLKYADAAKLEGILTELFDAKQKAEQESNQDLKDSLTVMADTRSNSLLLTGTRDYLDEAEGLIMQLDRQFEGTVVVEPMKVKLNSAANIASLLQDVVDKALAQQDSALQGTPIYISSDPVTDTLLIAAAREDMEVIRRWVEILDRPSELGRKSLIVALSRANAENVSQTVSELFKTTGDEGGAIDVNVTYDESTNSVVAFGPPAVLREIASFVKQMDSTEPGGGVVVKRFKLKQAVAQDAAELLQQVLEDSTSNSKSNNVMLFYQRQHPEVGAETLRALRREITVVPDTRTNALMVRAPQESMELMASLIDDIDAEPDEARIRVFRLVHSDASQMVDMLQELFERQSVATTTGGGSNTNDEARVLTISGLGSSGREEIAFTTDIRTNSVIAAGTPGYLDTVERMITDLDMVPVQDFDTFVYSPNYIPATAIADSLREFSDEAQQRLENIGEDVSRAELQRVNVTAIANEDANRIVIGVDPRYRDRVMQVIEGLDQPTPQVLIEVLIMEVTASNALDLGVEFAFQDLQYSKAGATDTTTFDYVGGTDVGAAGSGLGGFTFTVTGADFNFLFRTLQTEGNLEVLSRPQIVAMDNKEAKIDVSNDTPYVTGTQTSSTGQISTSVGRRSVGIVLTVTPQINPDGFVTMQIEQEVSDLTDSTIDVGSGVSSPIFFDRDTTTNIMVKDHETVVLGGLITARKQNTEQKVPLIGNLPILGTLFRSQSDDTSRTELLLVLTPHIIRNEADFRSISQAKRNEYSLIPDDALDSPLMGSLRAEPDAEFSGEAPDASHTSAPVPATTRETPSQPAAELYGPVRPTSGRPDANADDPDSYIVPRRLMSRPSAS